MPHELKSTGGIRVKNLVKSVSRVNATPDAKYAAGFPKVLHDRKMGIPGNYNVGWVGFQGCDTLVLDIELADAVNPEQVSVGFCHNAPDWVLRPEQVIVQWSKDGNRYSGRRTLEPLALPSDEQRDCRRIETQYRFARKGIFRCPEARKVRHLRITVLPQQSLPAWHPNAGEPAWLMIDEINVQ